MILLISVLIRCRCYIIENCTQSQFVIQITCLDFLVEVTDNFSSNKQASIFWLLCLYHCCSMGGGFCRSQSLPLNQFSARFGEAPRSFCCMPDFWVVAASALKGVNGMLTKSRPLWSDSGFHHIFSVDALWGHDAGMCSFSATQQYKSGVLIHRVVLEMELFFSIFFF